MGIQIKAIWNEIERARSNSTESECKFPMNEPATPDQLEQHLTRVLDIAIPKQLNDSLLIHDGMDERRGSWFAQCNMLIPCSAVCIERMWKLDRKRAAEAQAERDTWINDPLWIPTITDAIAEHTIYTDARDGSILCYVHAGLYVEEIRFSSYLEFLEVVLDKIKSSELFEWPS